MTRRISGTELRDRLLSRMKQPSESKPTEKTRIQVLSSAGNMGLLEIIATKQPHSIGELATLAGRLQPNVSRSLTALIRGGLVTVIMQGRASVPALTAEGRQKAEALGFVAQVPLSANTQSPIPESPISTDDGRVITATIAESSDDDSASDAVQANLRLRFVTGEAQKPITAHASINLTEVSKTLVANWWRIVCRRGDPFKMFPIQKDASKDASQAILLAASTGRIILFVRSILEDGDAWRFPQVILNEDKFTNIVFDELVRPLVSRLRASKRFDHPVESLLRRTEEILHTKRDLKFWRTAGALGLSYPTMGESAANDVANLITAISNEDARLDLASANSATQIGESLSWIKEEVAAKAEVNKLPRLIELKRSTKAAPAGGKPYQVGTERARDVRSRLGLSPDRPVGGIAGLATTFGGDRKFRLSPAGEELLRGHQSHGADYPVVVVKDEGPKSTAFLMSRAIGDYLVFGSREASIVDIYSDRQAVGRAFAAEFMAPAESVVAMVEEGTSLDTIAEHYGVIREVVRRQYENNVAQYVTAA
jgi:DNA-binding MarR family transcriptional regulator